MPANMKHALSRASGRSVLVRMQIAGNEWPTDVKNELSSGNVPLSLTTACFILAGIDEKSLLQAVDTAVEMNKNQDNGIPVPNYVDENVSTKTVKLIQSYTGVVNKMIWRK